MVIKIIYMQPKCMVLVPILHFQTSVVNAQIKKYKHTTN